MRHAKRDPYLEEVLRMSWDWYGKHRLWAKCPATWRGVPISKGPCDLWAYVEIIQKVQPSLIIELGTSSGGSALFFADMARMFKPDAKVLTFDIQRKAYDKDGAMPHDGVEFVVEDVTSQEAVDRAYAAVDAQGGPVMVSEDSLHDGKHGHWAKVLELYSPLVTPGSYFVVEDTMDLKNNYREVKVINDFVANNPFVIDRNMERFMITSNPFGFLRREG